MIERWSQLYDSLKIREYSLVLFRHIPDSVYEGLASLFLVGVVVLCIWKGLKKGTQFSAALLCTEYIALVFCSTIIFRRPQLERDFNLQPFWSYNVPSLFTENIMNVLMFVPIGLLLGVGIKGLKWWNALLVGACLSILIEVLQFVFKKGFSEVDDVMHNTLGCLIGYILCMTIIKIKNYSMNCCK